MSTEWRSVALGTVADLCWGDTKTTKASYSPTGYPAYSASGADGFLPHYDYDRTGVVLSAIGSDCGKSWLARGKWSCIKNTIRFFSTSDDVDTEFLYWATRRSDFWPQRGSGQPFISQGDARACLVAIPPLVEQRAIAQVLSVLDNKVHANTHLNETLEGISRALFRSWFIDFSPVRAKADGHPTGLAADIEALFSAAVLEEGGIEAPEGWRVGLLADVLELSRPTVDPKSLSGASVAHFSIPAFDQDGLAKLEPANGIASNKAHVPLNSVLFSKLNPETPRVWPILMDEGLPMIASTEFLPLQPRGYFGLAYAWRLLASEPFRDRAAACVTGTSKSHQRVQPASLMAQSALIPPEAVVRAFEETAGPMLSRIEIGKRQSRTLASLRDLLLPQLMSGMIRVKDAEAMLEAAQ